MFYDGLGMWHKSIMDLKRKKTLKGKCLQKIIKTIKIMIDRGANIEVKTSSKDYTPLHLACKNGHWEVAELLIKKRGAYIKARTRSYNYSPLHLACKNGDKEIGKMLCSFGSPLNYK